MRLFLLTSLTMMAFAANSVLNRAALVTGDMTALQFSAIRAMSGAMMLLVLVLWQSGNLGRLRAASITGGAMLALYLVGFSIAYTHMDSGVGALILFGGVQITMFGSALIARESIPLQRWVGAALAFAGLVVLVWPSDYSGSWMHAEIFMGLAALGWGIYSLLGRGAKDPLAATAGNFAYACLPVGVALMMLDGLRIPELTIALFYAVLSGAITSGLGYALWYQLLPQLRTSIAAIAQLSVPLIAAAGGVIFLSEATDNRFWVAAFLVLGGIALSLFPSRKRLSNS